MTGWHWLFGGEVYYPSGGMNDLLGMYPTLDAAKAMRRRYRFRLRVVGGWVSVLKAPLGVRRGEWSGWRLITVHQQSIGNEE